MKPAPFDYYAPDSRSEVLDLLAEHGDDAVLIAGGQSLVPLLNMRLARPAVVIDLRRVDDLATYEIDDDSRLCVGAMTTAATLEGDARIGAGLQEALLELAHPQIRARTTIGGSIAHADPAAELPAALLALDGAITVVSRHSGETMLRAEHFFEGPFMTTRAPDQLVTDVIFQPFTGDTTTVEVARRPGDFAIAGAFVGLEMDDGTVAELRLGLFGVGDRPIRLRSVEDEAQGQPLAPAEIGDAVRETVDPRTDVHGTSDYRRSLAGTLVERALVALNGPNR